MRKFVLLFSMILLGSSTLFAQNQRVSGTVTGPDGAPVIGATVLVEGTQTAAFTDPSGQYSISVPANANLVYSYFGLESQTLAVGGRTVINVVMAVNENLIDRVVVTALGMAKSEKALSYSANQVDAEEIERGGSRSLLSAVQGKLAGVNISSSSGSPGASSRVVLRGYSSITGDNEPLWVIDGVPMSNSARVNTNWNKGSVDYGNRGNDVNPDDIESMSILKGSAASALYGSRAANGVILITTKSGQARDKVLVEYTNDTKFTSVAYLPQMQNRFGQGWSSHDYLDENGSWGPKFTGEYRLWGRVVDGEQLYKKYVALPNNIRDFYETGLSETNSINISGGRDNTTFFMSYANTLQDGVLPSDIDFLKRNAISLRGQTKGKFLTASASMNYSNKKVSQSQGGGGTGSFSVVDNLAQVPRDMSIVDMKDYHNKFYNIDNYYTPYGIINPYQTLAEDGNLFNEDRMFGNVQLTGQILDWMTATVRAGNDYSAYQEERWRAVAIPAPGSPNDGSSTSNPGSYYLRSGYNNEFTLDAFAQMNPHIGEDFSLSGLVGYQINSRRDSWHDAEVIGLTLPGFYDISNSASTPTVDQNLERRRMIGAYMNVDLDWRSTVFLNVAMRNDWSSTLPKGKNSFFYPSVGLSASLTDAFPALRRVMTFAKVRASYGETGNDARPYTLSSVFAPASIDNAFGGLTFPLGAVNGYEVGNIIGNPNLKPERTKEYELGFDFRFLNNRLGIDFTYYNSKSVDQILQVPMAESSGYTSQWLNMGKISNKGLEIVLNATPVRVGDFNWDVTFTFSRNRSMVLQLAEGLSEVSLGGIGSGVQMYAIVGQPMGTFKGLKPMMVELDSEYRPVTTPGTGTQKMVVGTNGVPLKSDTREMMGSIQADFKAGFQTTFSWKDLSLSATVDGQKGGLMYSDTQSINYFVGNAPETLFNDRQPLVVPNTVQRILDPNDTTGKKTVYYENNVPLTMDMIASPNLFSGSGDSRLGERSLLVDRTNIRLREVVLSYRFPSQWFTNAPISGLQLSAIGTNLLLWRPKGNRVIDPESSTQGNNLAGEFGEMGGLPSVRTFGFNLKVTF